MSQPTFYLLFMEVLINCNQKHTRFPIASTCFEITQHTQLVEVYFPLTAAKGYGIFLTLFHRDFRDCLEVGLIAIFLMLFTTSRCFLFRYRAVLPDEHFISRHRPVWMLLLYFAFGFLICFGSMCVYAFKCENPITSSGMAEQLAAYPQRSYLVFDDDICFLDITQPIAPPFLNFHGGVGFMAIIGGFVPIILGVAFGILTHAFTILNGNAQHMSQKTRLAQKKVVWPQELLNLLMAFLGMHGTVSSTLIALLTEPYRRYIKTQIFRFPGNGAVTSVIVTSFTYT
ncbi:unnamed protein product, partial [Mesorhabditis belari]|uniref:Uncharacterized protein n=1 Tax=Mesorhabditis belari TaxID=2138241 RepID=A0AAF3FJH4_9BILA